MKEILIGIQIVISILLIASILAQARGTGFGGGSAPKSFTRRGFEKIVFKATFVLAAIFIIISILQLTF